MKRSTLGAVFLSLGVSFTAQAGSEVRNGGYGVYLNKGANAGQTQLFDFYYHGVEPRLPQPQNLTGISLDERRAIAKRVDRMLDGFFRFENLPKTQKNIAEPSWRKISEAAQRLNRAAVVDAVTQSLLAIADLQKKYGYAIDFDKLLSHAEQYEWALNPVPCRSVNDESRIIDKDEGELRQAAYRQGLAVRSCLDAYAMDFTNFNGLIMHEIVYAASLHKGNTTEFVALLFSLDFNNLPESLDDKDANILATVQNDLIPTPQELTVGYQVPVAGIYTSIDIEGNSRTLEVFEDIKFDDLGIATQIELQRDGSGIVVLDSNAKHVFEHHKRVVKDGKIGKDLEFSIRFFRIGDKKAIFLRDVSSNQMYFYWLKKS